MTITTTVIRRRILTKIWIKVAGAHAIKDEVTGLRVKPVRACITYVGPRFDIVRLYDKSGQFIRSYDATVKPRQAMPYWVNRAILENDPTKPPEPRRKRNMA